MKPPRERLSEMAVKRPKPGYRPRPRSASREEPLTADRIEHAMVYLAFLIAATGETQHMPLLEKLERELKKYRAAADPMARARKILADHTIEGKAVKAIF